MSDRIFCYAHLNAKIMPIAQGKIFETPLEKALAGKLFGAVEGGGTLQEKNGEIIYCGIDVELELTEANVAFVCEFLRQCGAPKGSKLQFTRDGEEVEVPFGDVEGIGVYLNGTDLPAEVYRTSDINVVMETFQKLTRGCCLMTGYWRGHAETALYMYGPSASMIESRISGFLSEYPLCQRARVVRIA